MQPIPDDILKQFNAVLEQKFISASLQENYQKWLKYYLDFRVKYPPPDIKSEQVRLFIEKMRSKGKTGKDLGHAAHALSLFFSLQGRKKQAVDHAEKVRAEFSRRPVEGKSSGAGEAEQTNRDKGAVEQATPAARRMPLRRGGRKYDEWWSLERTKSSEWTRS